MQVAVVSKAKTMAIVFEESNLPEWANRMVTLKQGQEVQLGGVEGKIESFSNATTGSVIASLLLKDGSKQSVQIVHRINQ